MNLFNSKAHFYTFLLLILFLIFNHKAYSSLTDVPTDWTNFNQTRVVTIGGNPVRDYETSDDPTTGGSVANGGQAFSSGCGSGGLACNESNCNPNLMGGFNGCGLDTTAFWDCYDGGTSADASDDFFFFRVRVNGDPTQGAFLWSNGKWNTLIDVDGDGISDFWVLLDGNRDTLYIIYDDNTDGTDEANGNCEIADMDPTCDIVDEFSACNDENLSACDSSGTDLTHTRAVELPGTPGAGPDNEWYVDVQFPASSLTDGIGGTQQLGCSPDDPNIPTGFSLKLTTSNSNVDPLQKDFAFIDSTDLLPITLTSFSSNLIANNLNISWQTGMEVMNVGFNVYGYIEGEKIKLNKEIIPSKRPDSVVPQYYEERIEVPNGVEQLGISSVDTRGKEDYFGPFEIGASYGEEVEVKKVNWERVKEEYTQKMISKGYVNKGGVMRSSRVGNGSYISKLVRTASKTGGEVVCNVGVREDGMYRVSYEELALEGCDFNGEKPNKIAVTFKGEPVARRVKGVGGSFTAGSYIDFYGKEVRGDDVLYTVENVYQISVDRSSVKKHTVIKGIPQVTQESYVEEAQINKNEFYSMNVAYGVNGEKDPWYENTLFATPSSNAVSSHTIVVDNDVDTQASGLLRVNLAGISSHNGAGADHEVRLKLNGVDKGLYKNDGVVNWDIEVVTNPGEITPGVNTLVVEATGNTGYSFDLVFVNNYALSYERPTVANGDVLNYTGNANGYKVSGFSARAGIEVYGEQGGNLYKINGGKKQKEGAGNFSISFKGIGGEANYYAGIGLNKGNVYISEINKSITEGSADVIVLTHTVFEGLELNSYVNNIENRGHTVKVVNVQDVYETYGYGMPLPEAITTYLKASKSSIGNEYVVIVGATVTDPPTSEEVISFVPTEYEFTQGVIYYTPSDGVMMDFNGDNIPELAVSRLPVRLSSEISTFVNKLNNYTPKASALLVAEDPSGGLDFGNQLDQIEASTFGGSYSVSKVYLENQGEIPVKKQEMLDILNLDEPGLVMMDGHANPSSFVFAGMMTSNDASGLTNSDSAVFIPLACFMTYYPTSGVNTLSHQLLFNPQGGSVAITGAITFSGFNENGVYAESITKKMMSGKTLGRAVLETKQENPGLTDQLINWETIGDLFTTLPNF